MILSFFMIQLFVNFSLNGGILTIVLDTILFNSILLHFDIKTNEPALSV